METMNTPQPPVDSSAQKNTSVFQYALKWALILALVEIIYSLILYLTNQFENRSIGWLMYAVMGLIAFVAVKNFRDKESDGYISFGKGFNISFQTIFFAGIVTAVYSFIFFKYIDPTVIEHMLQTAEQNMIDKGIPDEQIEQGLKYSKMFMTPGMMALWSVVGTAVTGAIVSLIVAAICRKENKELFPPQ